MYFLFIVRKSAIRFFTLPLLVLYLFSCKSFGLEFEYALLKNVPVDVPIEQILLNPEQYRFSPSEKIYGAGYNQQASWVRLRLSKHLIESDRQWYLQFYAPAQKQVFFRNSGGSWQSLDLTLSHPLHLDKFLSFKQTLHLNPILSDYREIYIKTVDKGPHSMGLRIVEQGTLLKTEFVENLFWGGTVSFVLLVGIIALGVWLYSLSSMYFYFACLCFVVVTWDVLLLQYVKLFSPDTFSRWYLLGVDTCTVLMPTLTLLFLRQYTEFWSLKPRFDKVVHVTPLLALASLVFIHGPIKLTFAQELMALASALCAIFAICVLVIGMKAKSRAASVAFIAWAPGVAVSAVSIPMFLDLLPENWVSVNIAALGSSFVCLSFGVALLDKVYLLRRQRDALQVEQAQRLERKVAEQTQHLMEQTEEIGRQRQALEITLNYKEDLLANIAHELKTPLTLMLGLLNGKYPEKERKNKLYRLIYRISHLLDNMLDLARKTSNSPVDEEQSAYCYRAHEFVEFYLTTYRSFVTESRLQVTGNQFADVYCAPDTLDKVITNLINNAIKYSPTDTPIFVDAFVKDEHWYFSIENSGPGISPDKLHAAFERYVRLGDAEQSYGLGLGLPLVKQLVEKAFGGIDIKSGAGANTQVQIWLPLATDHQLAAQQSRSVEDIELSEEHRQWLHAELAESERLDNQDVPTPKVSNNDAIIYCIDDNAELLHQLKEQLGGHYQLTCFSNPEEAIHEARNIIPDLVICDVMMPQMSGFDLLNQLRQDELLSHIPVILLSARADRQSIEQGFIEMADDYITKPYEPRHLMLKIENIMTMRQLLKTRFQVTLCKETEQDNTDELSKLSVFFEQCPPNQVQFLKKMIEQLKAQLHNPEFSIKHLSDSMFLSDSQIRRKCKAVSGYSPQEILKILRLEAASSLIREGYNLKSIAHDCGFSSQSHMGAAFKAYFGYTPNQYRKQCVGAGASADS